MSTFSLCQCPFQGRIPGRGSLVGEPQGPGGPHNQWWSITQALHHSMTIFKKYWASLHQNCPCHYSWPMNAAYHLHLLPDESATKVQKGELPSKATICPQLDGGWLYRLNSGAIGILLYLVGILWSVSWKTKKAARVIVNLITYFETQTNHRAQKGVLKSDRGIEFMKKNIKKYVMRKEYIINSPTAPVSPQQNGSYYRAERLNKTVAMIIARVPWRPNLLFIVYVYKCLLADS